MNYTNIEQSKKLLELGLNPDSSDMFWEHVGDSSTPYTIAVNVGHRKLSLDRTVPSWSTDALLQLLPKYQDNYSCFITAGGAVHVSFMSQINLKPGDISHLEKAETPFKALYNLTCWLLENGYIDKTKQ